MFSIESADIVQAVAYIVGFLLVSLLSLNAWFVRRLVAKLDSVSDTVNSVNGALPTQNLKIEGLEKSVEAVKDQITAFGQDMKEMNELKIKVAVLEHQMKSERRSRGQNDKNPSGSS